MNNLDLIKENEKLKMELLIKNNEIMRLQADLEMSKDRIKFLEGGNNVL